MLRNTILIVCATGLVLSLVAAACGTAVYNHVVTVSTLNGAAAKVGVFNHQQGYSREWAHRALGDTSQAATYSTTLTTTPAVTIGSVHDARPVEIALAIPELTDEGYFMLTVDAPASRAAREARFTRYDEYSPRPDAKTIPVLVSATAKQGTWTIELTVDVVAARQQM